MSTHVSIQEVLEAAIVRALATLSSNGVLPAHVELPLTITLERPKNRDHGDYATSIALALAKSAGIAPRDIATALQAALLADAAVSKDLAAVDIAGAGFLNLTLAKASQGGVIASILTSGSEFGKSSTLSLESRFEVQHLASLVPKLDITGLTSKILLQQSSQQTQNLKNFQKSNPFMHSAMPVMRSSLPISSVFSII